MAGALVARLPSSRHADVVYEVRIDESGYSCSCPAWSFRKKCRHVTALADLRALPVTAGADHEPPSDVSERTWDGD
jgi:hypothetical protein